MTERQHQLLQVSADPDPSLGTFNPADVFSTAKAISDDGMLIVTAAVYIIISSSLLFFIVKWFKSLITKVIEQQTAQLQALTDSVGELLREVRKQADLTSDIAEHLQADSMLKLTVLVNYTFDYLAEHVCRMVAQVRRENHIDDKVATERKVRTLLTNIFSQIQQGFSYYKWRGKSLSDYLNPNTTDTILELFLLELYNANENETRTFTTISANIEVLKNELLTTLR